MFRQNWTLLVVLLLAPAIANATPTASDIARARQLFSEAVAAEDKSDWQLAAAKLREAIAIKETAGLRFHLAYCEEQLGRLVEALAEYDRAGELAANDPKAADVRRMLGPSRRALLGRIPTVTVVLPEGITDASLEVNGRELPSSLFGQPIRRNPGLASVRVTIPGHEPFLRDLLLSEGDAVVVTVDAVPVPVSPVTAEKLPNEPDAADKPRPDEAAPSLPLRTWILVSEGALATAALGIGIGYHLAANAADDRADAARAALAAQSPMANAQCAAPTEAARTLCADLARNVSDASSHRRIATVGFVTAGVSAAALVGTWLFWPSPTPSKPAAFRITPVATIGGETALILSGSF